MTYQQALDWRASLREQGKVLVLTNGCFDLLHRGHVEYLLASSQLGDALLVAINSDHSVRELKGPSRPLNSAGDRAFVVGALRGVAATFIFPGPRLDREIRELAPDIYTKAGDYSLATLDAGERNALEAVGATIHFVPFVAGHSTSALIERAGN